MNHARVEEIFLGALEITEAGARESYLNDACATDIGLRQQVDRLLSALPRAQGFLDSPAGRIESPADAETIDSAKQTDTGGEAQFQVDPKALVGTWIGPYKLLQLLGEGGMGTIYLAEQEQPVKRRVALKIIKVGMDSTTFTARFEQERQALAMMDHPHIAKVLDAGASNAGRPYFVMEYVQGVPITRFCDQQQLSPRQRMELFIPVCQAVQHAHQKGVIHRDLKPSNVLVAMYDGRPVPKVIDFGVAKVTHRKLTELTMQTEIGSIVGTLEYMAPEQAELNNMDIDTRADIYSLGVLLYELLTGSPPFTAEELRSAEFTEMLRMIREVEPARPSTRISTSEALPTIAANRKLEPKRLQSLLTGELDWIVMKCLAKERHRRYDTAVGLAADVARYLANEPVLAGPPKVSYRARKFLTRHRAAVATAAMCALLLVGGIVGTTWGWANANEAKRDAAAGENRAKAARAKLRAALDEVSSEAIATLLAQQPQLTDRHRALLTRTLELYEEFANDPGENPEDRREVALAHVRMGTIRGQLGELDGAAEAYKRAIALWESLVEEFPKHSPYVSELAKSHDSLGWVCDLQVNRTDAEANYRNAVALLTAIHETHPDNPAYISDLAYSRVHVANSLADRAQRKEAEAGYRTAIELLKSIPDPDETARVRLGNAQYNLALLLGEMELVEAAADEYKRSIEVLEALVADFPQEHGHERRLSNSFVNLGEIIARGDDWETARTYYDRGREIQEKLVREYPAIPEYQKYLGRTISSLADELANRNFFDDARAMYQEAIDVKRNLSLRYPKSPTYVRDLASTFNNRAYMELRNDNLEASEAGFRDAIALQEPLVENHPDIAEYRRELGNSYGNLGSLLARQEEFKQAKECILKCWEHNSFLADKYPEAPEHLLRQGADAGNVAELTAKLGDNEQALEWYAKALATMQQALDRMPEGSTVRNTWLFNSTSARAQLLQDMERFDEALADWEESQNLAPDSRSLWTQARTALCLVQLGKLDEAIGKIETLQAGEDPDGESLLVSARVYSQAMEKSPDRSEEFAPKCMEMLRKAQSAGVFDSSDSLEELDEDPHLTSIQQREDYQTWREELGHK